ncbi:transposase [Amycolatopsis mediterranei S699]|uniref:Transposase n=2 Tax=Amycolatopsis mediterranei TaxID=33910 RepID=A0A0H3D488_AMYMU|nr:transposase [Amycolatopsis mediterranei U32]AEK42253.1 transposase [Amycolatopsis mediterranei S699]AFO77193.1 transposase [Amycolatopsis mediterranei S699]AGT84321.1 transposase [Amycolatopsis mediterranei RB]KDU88798.1 transposase [Amycolatopsis mediterranei]
MYLPIMEVHLMTDMMSGVENAEDPKAETGLDGLDEQLVAQLVSRAKAGGLALTGEGGVLAQLTKRLLESALEGEITDHLGYDKHDRPVVGPATRVTAFGPRPCSPTSARSRSTCPGTGMPASSRRSWPSGGNAWAGWTRW